MAMLRQLSGRGRVVTTVDLKLDLVERCFLVIEYRSMQVAKETTGCTMPATWESKKEMPDD